MFDLFFLRARARGALLEDIEENGHDENLDGNVSGGDNASPSVASFSPASGGSLQMVRWRVKTGEFGMFVW
jgi:hypothetical protein